MTDPPGRLGLDDLSETEAAVLLAAHIGRPVDRRVGDPEQDRPENSAEWDEARSVRAEFLYELLVGALRPQGAPLRRVYLQGVRIRGELDLEGATLECPLLFFDCSFDERLRLTAATLPALRLGGSHVPELHAGQLVAHGDVRLNAGFAARKGVTLSNAKIGGQLTCADGLFANPDGVALEARAAIVNGDVSLTGEFKAHGTVSLAVARIGGSLRCSGEFANRDGVALNGTSIGVAQDLVFGDGFRAAGEVGLADGHVGSLFGRAAHFENPRDRALTLDGLVVDRDMVCAQGFVAHGEVRLPRARIAGLLQLNGGQFTKGKHSDYAILADAVIVGQAILCRDRFSATGEVRLLAAHVGRQLDCTGGRFRNPDGVALMCTQATVDGTVLFDPGEIVGRLELNEARVGRYEDRRETWPASISLDGFRYDSIIDIPAKERLDWLARDGAGYRPRPYEQLAATYRRSGRDDDARTIAIAKLRRRRRTLGPPGRAASALLDWTIGYGYRTWRVAVYFLVLLALSTMILGSAYPAHLSPVRPSALRPPFHAFLYALDVLLPVVNLHQRDAFAAHGGIEWFVAALTVAGWLLGTAAVVGLTGVLKKD